MSFQVYLDTVKAQTGKTVADFRTLAAEKGLSKHGEIVQWLKGDFGLGHGHATAVAAALLKPDTFKTPKAEKVDAVFSGKKAVWKPIYEALLEAVQGFGEDIDIAPTDTYVSLLRGGKKFATVQPAPSDWTWASNARAWTLAGVSRQRATGTAWSRTASASHRRRNWMPRFWRGCGPLMKEQTKMRLPPDTASLQRLLFSDSLYGCFTCWMVAPGEVGRYG